MVISTDSAVRVVPAPPVPPASVLNASPEGPHCRLKIVEFETVPGSVDNFTGMVQLGKCYQRFSLWAAGPRFKDMCQAKDLVLGGWQFVGETDHRAIAA